MSIVPLVVVPPVVPLTDQLTAGLVVPDTATENGNVSPARILAVGGDTTILTEDGGGEGGWLVLRAAPAQPATDMASNTILRCSNLRIPRTCTESRSMLFLAKGIVMSRGTGRKGR